MAEAEAETEAEQTLNARPWTWTQFTSWKNWVLFWIVCMSLLYLLLF